MSGNYSCNAENVFGRDQVVYQVVILVSPGPPSLLVPATTMHSISLQWKVTSDGGSPITGIHYWKHLIVNYIAIKHAKK